MLQLLAEIARCHNCVATCHANNLLSHSRLRSLHAHPSTTTMSETASWSLAHLLVTLLRLNRLLSRRKGPQQQPRLIALATALSSSFRTVIVAARASLRVAAGISPIIIPSPRVPAISQDDARILSPLSAVAVHVVCALQNGGETVSLGSQTHLGGVENHHHRYSLQRQKLQSHIACGLAARRRRLTERRASTLLPVAAHPLKLLQSPRAAPRCSIFECDDGDDEVDATTLTKQREPPVVDPSVAQRSLVIRCALEPDNVHLDPPSGVPILNDRDFSENEPAESVPNFFGGVGHVSVRSRRRQRRGLHGDCENSPPPTIDVALDLSTEAPPLGAHNSVYLSPPATVSKPPPDSTRAIGSRVRAIGGMLEASLVFHSPARDTAAPAPSVGARRGELVAINQQQASGAPLNINFGARDAAALGKQQQLKLMLDRSRAPPVSDAKAPDGRLPISALDAGTENEAPGVTSTTSSAKERSVGLIAVVPRSSRVQFDAALDKRPPPPFLSQIRQRRGE